MPSPSPREAPRTRPAISTKVRRVATILADFAKSEREWVEALCAVIADNAGLLAKGQDPSFQNKVHLTMQAKGFFLPKDAEEDD